MLVVERPGIFLGKAHNRESWYVVDPTYAKFEKDVIAQWRERYRPTNRPRWVRPLASFGAPLLLLGLVVLSALLLPYDGWSAGFIGSFVVTAVALVALLRIADIRWPGTAARDGHIHAVIAVDAGIANAATDYTGWLDLWEVSQGLHRARQAYAVRETLDEILEVLDAPDERRVITQTREQIDALFTRRDAEFNATTEWSTMFHKRLGIVDDGRAL